MSSGNGDWRRRVLLPPDEWLQREVEKFVNERLVVMYARNVTDVYDRAWCPEWWRHTEAWSRFEALWWAWHYLNGNPEAGLSHWWAKHADHHMEKLFDPQGPFKYCSVRNGHVETLTPLPTTPVPEHFYRMP